MNQTACYTTLLIPDEDVGGFTLRVPAIPAIVTEGDDRAHAREMAREAIELYIEAATDHGWELSVESAPAEGTPVEISVARAAEPVDP